MKLKKGSVLIETMIALIVSMIIVMSVLSFAKLAIVEHELVKSYEKGL